MKSLLPSGLSLSILATAFLAFAGCMTPTPRVTDRDVGAAASRGRRAFERGQFDVAATAYREALQRARLVNDSVGIGDSAYNLAACLLQLGRAPEAREQLREARAALAAEGSAGGAMAEAWLLEARAARAEGKADEAGNLADQAVAALSAGGHRDIRAQAQLLKADLACDAGDAKAAETNLAAARKSAGRHAQAPLAGATDRTEARLLGLQNNPKAAAAAYDRAAGSLREAGLYRDMASALGQAAENWDAAGDSAAAADRYMQAAASLQAQGDVAEALRRVSSALAAAEKCGNKDLKDRAVFLFNDMRKSVNDAFAEEGAKKP